MNSVNPVKTRTQLVVRGKIFPVNIEVHYVIEFFRIVRFFLLD